MKEQYCKHAELKTKGGKRPFTYKEEKTRSVSKYLKDQGLKLCRKEEAEYVVTTFLMNVLTGEKENETYYYARSDWKANYRLRCDCVLIDIKSKYPKIYESRQIYNSLTNFLDYAKLTKCRKEYATFILEVFKWDLDTGEKGYSVKYYVKDSNA